MEKATVDVYEARGTVWAERRKPVRSAHARAFARRVPTGGLRVDLGCGAGRYICDVGSPVVGIDAARAMLERCREVAPSASLVQGDLEALPFGKGSLKGGWANMSYLHLPAVRLPLALADLHRSLELGAPIDLQVLAGEYEGSALPSDDVGGRFFCAWEPSRLRDVTTGAGFEIEAMEEEEEVVRVRGRRMRTLPDFVGPGMKVLVVGLNPSLFAADAGVGYARPGNRFWPAALVSGLVTRDRDPWHALRAHGIGMTDLVKRATSAASDIRPQEYRDGLERIERLVRWLRPKAVCMVGLSGWRAAMDARAPAGPQEAKLGGRPVYLMPSTSGANAHTSASELAGHLRAATAMSAHSSSARSS